MKTEIIKYENQYAARYKKWYHLRWRYIGLRYTWLHAHDFCLTQTYEQALEKINNWFTEIVIISKNIK